jgi:hypothetical protein
MSPENLSAALDELDMTAGGFARLYGVPRERVIMWLEGQQDIPHTVGLVCVMLTVKPAAMLAGAYTDRVCRRNPALMGNDGEDGE